MPQGGRKTPFSGKAKKQQLQAKKERKNAATVQEGTRGLPHKAVSHASDDDSDGGIKIQKLNAQPSEGKKRRNTNRYNLQFHEDSKEEMEQRKELARHALKSLPETALEVDPDTPYPAELGFPKRPPWNSSMNREVLEAREQKYFREFTDQLGKKFGWSELSYFEMNLETWRQLWRVLEMSDVIIFIVDIRFPVYLFPPSLYSYVTETLGKDMILILNKIDLAPAPLVLAWKYFFKNRYPSLQVLTFTAVPGYNLRDSSSSKSGGLQVRRRKGKMRMAAEGAQQLIQACENIVGDKVDLSSWQKKIAEELHLEFEDENLEVGETIEVTDADAGYVKHERFLEGVLTIGCVGQPNVGKSSLMNAIMGKKVVSVSRTPGHTKHFQTIFLTPTVKLCDCPGLVFPSKIPRALQVLMGSYPIAQLREPFSSVQYLAERLDLVKLLHLKHPENDSEWSAFDICDAWAKLRGFVTAKAARLDSYRAANHILRIALDGKICLCLYPPQYIENRAKWETHLELDEVKKVQAKKDDEATAVIFEDLGLSSEEEEKPLVAKASTQSSELESEEEDLPTVSVASNKFALLDEQD